VPNEGVRLKVTDEGRRPPDECAVVALTDNSDFFGSVHEDGMNLSLAT